MDLVNVALNYYRLIKFLNASIFVPFWIRPAIIFKPGSGHLYAKVSGLVIASQI